LRAITTFLALSFGLSWAVAAWIHQSGGFAGLGAAMGTVSLMLFMLGPSIAAVVCTLLFDRDRWADALGFRGFGFGKVASWTVLSWITAIALTIASVLATVHVFGQQLGDPLTFMQTQLDAQGVEAPMPIENLLMIQMTVGLGVGLLFNTFYLLISEELGWRGWLQPRLADLGFWPASIVIGVIWGLWHLPIILMGHNYGDLGWTGVAAMVGFTVMLTPYHALARERGGVIAAAGMHGAINAVAGFSLMYLASPAWPWNGLTGVGGFAAMGGGWGLIFLYRMGRRKPATGYCRSIRQKKRRRETVAFCLSGCLEGSSLALVELAVTTIARQITRNDRFHCLGFNAEILKRLGAFGNHIVIAQLLELVLGQIGRDEGQDGCDLREHRNDLSDRERQRHQETWPRGVLQREFHQLLEGIGRRTAQLVGLAASCIALISREDGRSNITSEDGLEKRLATTEQGQCRHEAGNGAEHVEEAVIGPENDRGTQDGRTRHSGQHAGFAGGLGLGIFGFALGAGANRGDLDQFVDTGGGSGFSNRLGAHGVQAGKGLATALGQHADQIHDTGSTFNGAFHRARHPDIRLHQLHLANHTHHTQVLREVRAARGNTHAIAGLGQRADNMTTDKAGTAKHSDHFVAKHEGFLIKEECGLG